MTKASLMLIIAMALSPCIARAVPDCRIVEYADHFEATCEDPTAVSRVYRAGNDRNAVKNFSAESAPVAPMQKAERQPDGKAAAVTDRPVKENASRQRRRSVTAIEAAKATRMEQIIGSRQ